MIDKIDAVIPWVDGDDPNLKAKRQKYTGTSGIETRNDIAAPTRYASSGEIYWCVRGLQRFAPFVKKIYIVTDGQDPHIEDHIPDLTIPVEIVDHKVIFRGYEEYLPVFNSNAIEALVWQIPGLSENFIYLNDDFFIVKPVERSEWFDDEGRPVLYGRNYNTFTAKIAKWVNWIIKGKKVVKFRDGMLLAALLPGINAKSFIRLQHLPRSMNKRLLKEYYEKHPESVVQNIRHRFRDISQYNAQELNYLLLQREYDLEPVDAKPLLVTMGPSGERRFRRRYRKLTTLPSVKYLCVNSMDLIKEPQRLLIEEFLDKTFAK